MSKASGGYRRFTLSGKRIGDLDLTEDFRFQRRSWRFQRIGWLAMGVVGLLALAGFLGEGPASEARAGGTEEGLEVDFQRYGRRGAPQTLRFHIAGPPGPEGKVRLSIDREYLEGFEIDTVIPEPESVEGGPDRHIFEFIASQGQTTVSFKIRPEIIGPVRCVVALGDRPAVEFRQFIYP